MPKKRIKKKIRKNDNYKFMELYDDLHTVLTWMPLGRMKDINWKDKELVSNLWKWHGEKIMNEWETDPTHAGQRPRIWWHIFTKNEDFKILRYEKYTGLNGKPEPREMWPDGHLETEYPIYEGETAYLKRKNLLEDWELKEIESGKGVFWDESFYLQTDI